MGQGGGGGTKHGRRIGLGADLIDQVGGELLTHKGALQLPIEADLLGYVAANTTCTTPLTGDVGNRGGGD